MFNRSRLLNRRFAFRNFRGQRLLPLVAFMVATTAASAAVDQDARVQISRQQSQINQLQGQVSALEIWRTSIQDDNSALKARYDGLHEVQRQLNVQFLALREQQSTIASQSSALRADNQAIATQFGAVLAQVKALSETQQQNEFKLAQLEGQSGGRGMVQLLNQVDSLNGDLNKLRGKIEELNNSIANAEKRQKDMYLDLDTRIRRAEQQNAAGGLKKNEDAIAALEARIRKLEQSAAQAAAAIPAPVSTATGADAPAPGTAVAIAQPGSVISQGGATSVQSPLPGGEGTAQAAYDAALSTYRMGDYQGAVNAFQNFLRHYSQHALASNAHYWIGDAYYQLRDYRSAIDVQRKLIGAHPDSAKVPDAMLNIGSAELGLGDAAAARKSWEELVAKHPSSEAAEKARQRISRLR